jgi:hypothetical protein
LFFLQAYKEATTTSFPSGLTSRETGASGEGTELIFCKLPSGPIRAENTPPVFSFLSKFAAEVLGKFSK